ncbi:hypothetical protein ACIBCT_39855 [Streptosporangium sp. NPDC050855]|uniref:hypothetical protein n=1 Tax=Streptosporangium sp. NPDC050855 TaxID=3366194 RepID=UPI0037AD0DE9
MTTITDQIRDRAQRDRLADAPLDTAPRLGHRWTDTITGRLGALRRFPASEH